MRPRDGEALRTELTSLLALPDAEEAAVSARKLLLQPFRAPQDYLLAAVAFERVAACPEALRAQVEVNRRLGTYDAANAQTAAILAKRMAVTCPRSAPVQP